MSGFKHRVPDPDSQSWQNVRDRARRLRDIYGPQYKEHYGSGSMIEALIDLRVRQRNCYVLRPGNDVEELLEFL